MGDMMTFRVPLTSMKKINNSVQKNPDIMKKAIKKHNELYNDNITEVATEFYGMICV